MTTPARKLAEELWARGSGMGHLNNDLDRAEYVIAWLLDKQRKDRDYIRENFGDPLHKSADATWAARFDDGWKYGPPKKPVTKDERIEKLRRALRHCALREKGTDRDIRDLVNEALREDNDDGGTP